MVKSMTEAECQFRRLEALLNAYVKVCELWSRAAAGENKGMIAEAKRFLERLIRTEFK